LANLVGQAATIRDALLRATTEDLLANPAPTFMALHPTRDGRERIREALHAAGLLAADVTVEALFPPLTDARIAPQSFLAAPGGTPEHHHAHPGGLALHTAFNVEAALALERLYTTRYGVVLDHDIVVAASILHDAMKRSGLPLSSPLDAVRP
jgi:hypothetical protein